MRIVPASHRKGTLRCAVTGKTTDPEGFFETGTILSGWDPEICVSLGAAKEMALKMGWMSPDEVTKLTHANLLLSESNRNLTERVAKLETFLSLREELTEEVANAAG